MVLTDDVLTEQTNVKHPENEKVELVIYVAPHCPVCAYAHEVADDIRGRFPSVNLRLVDMEATTEPIPEAIFATPTYLLNGRVWSLGNPSPALVSETLSELTMP